MNAQRKENIARAIIANRSTAQLCEMFEATNCTSRENLLEEMMVRGWISRLQSFLSSPCVLRPCFRYQRPTPCRLCGYNVALGGIVALIVKEQCGVFPRNSLSRVAGF